MKTLVATLLLSLTACSTAPPAPSAAAAAQIPGPTRIEAGVPVGYPQSVDGARAAAIRYVAVLGGQLMFDPSRRDLALAAVSRGGRPAPDVAARWSTRPNVERATGARQAQQAGLPMIAAVAPVLSKVTAYDGDTATVAVWVTAVLGTEQFGSLDQAWVTETVTLLWDGDWKLAAYDSSPGPVPALHQVVTPLADALASTADMRGTFDATP
jgi:hypothetical protein